MTTDTGYTAKDIQVLEGLEAVRKRPAMYIGSTNRIGLHHLVYEVLDNSIDEALAGHCKNIEIMLYKDGSVSVTDDGRGIPVDKHDSGKSALEVVLTVLHAGGKFGKQAYAVSGGLHGVGVSVVNALSETLSVEVRRNGKTYAQTYHIGKPLSDVKVVGDTDKTGTMIRFKPNTKIFETVEFEYNYLKERIMELAFLNAGLRIKMSDERDGNEQEFYYEGGIKEFVEHINKARTKLHAPVHFKKTKDNNEIEYALQYTDSYSESIYSFVNNIKTVDGGTHVSGFRTALTRVVNEYMRINKILKNDKKMSGDDAIEGLAGIISIKIPEPQFEGQTKAKLGNSEIKGIVDSVVYDSLMTYLEEHPTEAKRIMQKIISSMEAREAAQKAKELIRRKSVFESSILPGKLSDCIEKDPSKCEIFVVEGDSAGGSGRQGRDRNYQAILPLKGKILNVEKAPMHKVLTSEEIKAIVLSIGAGFGEDFDATKARYHKFVIMTDADVDGAHIRTLILTLFYRHFKPLIEKGYLYIAQPPLYKIKQGKSIQYAYSDAQLQEVLKQTGEKVDIQRYKGLGEMNPEQLWETTMNPETRTLKQVTIEDAIVADELFTILMGDEVAPRKEFIEQYAKQVKNLDI
ncbi:DNA topoisomerase (ATP-hydrolyzing) subunit B [Candidatus Micrarchaeota archaeon]|nr:DNA topoisomerase (ATP-hydrolyzing) subunit B [Candidatus Micrarchaeota archaeon]MBU1166123.1 DNA topoisomerase (ATP-hydrolyzing) subunit B [Candidatus Micrarchaeota archaeon]MBU1887334.1 DNA topoisomerase (ATP-hydrolyzing) subunit B [Candidatus Micrarchaeota archaeon]